MVINKLNKILFKILLLITTAYHLFITCLIINTEKRENKFINYHNKQIFFRKISKY